MVGLFLDGGGFMYPILLIFIFGFAFVGERLYYLISGLSSNYKFAQHVANTIASEGIEPALAKCDRAVGPVANICYAALQNANEGVDVAEKSAEQAAGIEMASLEKNMTWISLSIAIAPMFGFLGTVWGMIKAFEAIAAANNVNAKIVAEGISVALLTTAFGLLVALILQFLQNLVMYIIDNQIVNMQKSVALILDRIYKFNKSNQ